mmetsp:Transcript_2110/g.4842  ORF Transcript_2110/g.4842 Transcript_2110/m.4842 type:complete len:219 (+) Transcript_2110:2212-2868(+)
MEPMARAPGLILPSTRAMGAMETEGAVSDITVKWLVALASTLHLYTCAVMLYWVPTVRRFLGRVRTLHAGRVLLAQAEAMEALSDAEQPLSQVQETCSGHAGVVRTPPTSGSTAQTRILSSEATLNVKLPPGASSAVGAEATEDTLTVAVVYRSVVLVVLVPLAAISVTLTVQMKVSPAGRTNEGRSKLGRSRGMVALVRARMAAVADAPVESRIDHE